MKQDFHTAKLLEKALKDINSEIGDLQMQIRFKEKVRQGYQNKLTALKEDYHAVIPKDCKTHSEWNYCGKDQMPWSHVRSNRKLAYDLFICCNNYQECYHIVPLTNEEIEAYEKYLKTEKITNEKN